MKVVAQFSESIKVLNLEPLKLPVRISAWALHVGKLVVTCRCPAVYMCRILTN